MKIFKPIKKFANHGGANYATKTGHNRKAERAYDRRANDFARTIAGMHSDQASGFHKPGSRKTVY